jgi:hypothetical protein
MVGDGGTPPTPSSSPFADHLPHTFGPAGDKRPLAGKLSGCHQVISSLAIFSPVIVKW